MQFGTSGYNTNKRQPSMFKIPKKVTRKARRKIVNYTAKTAYASIVRSKSKQMHTLHSSTSIYLFVHITYIIT